MWVRVFRKSMNYQQQQQSSNPVSFHYLFPPTLKKAWAHTHYNSKLLMTAEVSNCTDVKGNYFVIVCVSALPMYVSAPMQRRRMFSRRPRQKWLPLWWKGLPRVCRCVEKGEFEIVSQWLWLPSTGPGHYITESLLSSPWEWLTA